MPILALNMGVLNEHSTPRKDFDCRSTEKQMLHDGKLGQLGPNRMTDQNISKAFYIDSILRSSSSASSKSEHSEIKDDIQVSDTSISSSVSKTFQETRSERGSPSSTSSAHSSTGGTGGYVRPTPVSLRPALLYATQPSAPTSSCGSQNHHHHHLSASSLDIFGLGSSYSSGSTPLYSSHISACLDSTPHPYAVSLNNNLSTGFHVGPLTNNSSPLYNSSSSSWLQGKPQLFSFQGKKKCFFKELSVVIRFRCLQIE